MLRGTSETTRVNRQGFQARVQAFIKLAQRDQLSAAYQIRTKIQQQGRVLPEDLLLISSLRGEGPSINVPDTYCRIISELPEVRHQLSPAEQQLFWLTKTRNLKSGLPTDVFSEEGLTLSELRIPLAIAANKWPSQASSATMARLLMVFKPAEITQVLESLKIEPEITDVPSLIYSKRFRMASPLVRKRANPDLAGHFIIRPSYHTCNEAESWFFEAHEDGDLKLVDKYLLYSTRNDCALALKTFTNAAGQVFLKGVIYGTTMAGKKCIAEKGQNEEHPWQILREWRYFRFSSKAVRPVDYYVEEYLG